MIKNENCGDFYFLGGRVVVWIINSEKINFYSVPFHIQKLLQGHGRGSGGTF